MAMGEISLIGLIGVIGLIGAMMVGVVVGALLLKESLTPKRISGVALMVLGVVLIGLAK